MAVGDEDGARPLVGEGARGELAGVAGAQDDDVPALEVPENAEGQVHGDRRDADATRADAGLRAHALAGRQGRCEQPVQERPGAALAHRRLVRPADLALDLGLAEDHRLESRRDAI